MPGLHVFEWLASCLSALPSQCAICRAWPARPLCDACVARFAQPAARCHHCAARVPPGVRQCGRCLGEPLLDACFAACDYAWPWTECITRFKFHRQPQWATPLALLMRATPWVEPALDSATLVLPIPLHPRRLRERGFNQALELARRLAPGRCDAALLLRVRDTSAQANLPRAQRLANLRGAFALESLRATGVQGQRVLLVDDVLTTGATLQAAAQVLREAGAAQVQALVLARTEASA